ncbi:hypothetical protein GCM10011371_11310 [Novosphingobium marinum]|uniref:DUF4350 domain-containing protein n=1 Tax=Novosphingobium marinum TaxID=1514948 RepID=A0A7Z0BVE1_9SPHN|nr:DUF4350 domain-containing protein [Novosphingobium marinum]NYH95240.1 hypothetical protein [Novosphingobium marinum]GGC25454.1 hypothetical protein GCM10011371_11310 [Novosphingobium marinum]
MPHRRSFIAALACASLLLGACTREHETEPAPDRETRETIGLFTSLPIFWREAGSVSEFLGEAGAPHWARQAIEQDARLVPLDTLAGKGNAGKPGTLPLDTDALLLLAQPRPLSPDENVALDDWVRAGGTVMLFVDPMLTGHSIYALGDPRRPQDIAMLSPILSRWGLELRFDEEQPEGGRMVEALGAQVPVNLHGTFRVIDQESCEPGKVGDEAGGLVVTCRIGKGRVVAIADAALFEETGEDAARAAALKTILESARR